jgi:hypothetical protein
MSGCDKQREESHDDDLAYVRKGAPDPLGLDYLSVHWSLNRLAVNLVDVGSLIAKRVRERVANRHRLI